LLNCAGEEARDIFDSFNLDTEANTTTCAVVLEQFRTYCNPKAKPKGCNKCGTYCNPNPEPKKRLVLESYKF